MALSAEPTFPQPTTDPIELDGGPHPAPVSQRHLLRIFLLTIAKQAGRFVLPGPAGDHHRPRWIVAILCGAGAACALLAHLFLPTVVGLSGDGHALVCQVGVAGTAGSTPATGGYLSPSWVPHQWYGEACPSGPHHLPGTFSSQLLILWAARGLTPLLGLGPGLDLRVAGLVAALVFGAIVMFLVTQLPGRGGFRIVVAAMVTLVMSEGVFVDLLISPYQDASAFLGLVAVFTGLLYLWRHKTPDVRGLAVLAVTAGFAITADTRMVALVPVLAVAALWHPFRHQHHHEPAASRSSRLVRAIALRLPALVLAVILVLAGGAVTWLQQTTATEAALYDTVFSEILPHSPHPKRDLEWFGLNPDWAESTGTTTQSANAAVFDDDWPEFTRHVSQSEIALFYLTHPDRLVGLADRGLDAMAQPQLTGLGSFLPHSGHAPGTQEHRFPDAAPVTGLLAAVPLLSVLVQALAFILGLAVAFRPRLGQRAVAFGSGVVTLTVGCWALFWTTLTSGEPSQLPGEMLPATFASALSAVWIATSVLILFREYGPKHRHATRGRDRAHAD